MCSIDGERKKMSGKDSYTEFEEACRAISHQDLSNLLYGIINAANVPFFLAVENDEKNGWIVSSNLPGKLDVMMVIYALSEGLGNDRGLILGEMAEFLKKEAEEK